MLSHIFLFMVIMYHKFISNIRAPIVFTVVAITIGFTMYILIDETVFGTITAFKFTSVIVGAFGTKMLLAAAERAFPTMFLMLIGNLLMVTTAAKALDANSFQDLSFQNLLLGIAGSIVVLIGFLMELLKKDKV